MHSLCGEGCVANTYLDADKVLVLNASFQNININEPIQECMMRITTSPWATRLWTFQEGVLALQLHFQFCDGTVTPSTLEIRSQAEGMVTPPLPAFSGITQHGHSWEIW
jgi:hypothetical protein